MLTRRELLLLLVGFLSFGASPAFAKKGGDDDDDDDDGGGNSGSGGNDDDDDDDDSGGGNGGGGGNDDDDDSGGGGNDDDDDDNAGGSGGDDNKSNRRNAKSARDAVKKGKAASLKDVLRLVRNRYPGRVIKVDVSGSSDDIIYTIKLIDEKNRRMQIRVNANKRRILGAKYI